MSDLRSALESAISDAETAAEPVEAAPVESSVSEAPAAPTEEKIEQASSVQEDTPKAEPTETKPEPEVKAETKPDQTDENKFHRVDRAPQSWKKEAKGEWNALPLHIRQEVHRRETEIARALQQSAPARQLAEQFQQTVTPFMARIQQNGVQPLQAVEHLLRADHTLSTAPKEQRAQFMAKLIKDYDVDISALDSALVGTQSAQPAQNQDIQALVQQQLQQALAPLMQERQQIQQMQQQKVVQTVESMSLDPKFEHFDSVREDMADLIEMSAKRGIDLSLEDAYDRAVRMNPDISAQMNRQVSFDHATQQHQQAQRAKVAASSVTGAPASGGLQSHVGDGSLRGAIEAAFSGQRV